MGTLSGEATLLLSFLPPVSLRVNSYRKEFAPIGANSFYAPEETSGGILKSHRPSVSPSVRYKSCLSDISSTTEANLMKLHRKIKHNEKVCRAHDLGSYAQGQGRNQLKGQNLVSAITQKLLKQI